jgi:acetylornithine/succinyldiaminopimelate/putrescine aminotransferase
MTQVDRRSPPGHALIELENRYGVNNYHPLDAVIERGEGVYLWDVEGKRYMDFLAAYSAVNQGLGERSVGARSARDPIRDCSTRLHAISCAVARQATLLAGH